MKLQKKKLQCLEAPPEKFPMLTAVRNCCGSTERNVKFSCRRPKLNDPKSNAQVSAEASRSGVLSHIVSVTPSSVHQSRKCLDTCLIMTNRR